MFDSGIKAVDLINGIIAESDIAEAIPLSIYCTWLDSTEQLLYSDFIREERIAVVSISDNEFYMNDILTVEAQPLFEDVYRVYAIDDIGKKIELEKTNLSGSNVFDNRNLYWKNGNKVGVKIDFSFSSSEVEVIYYVRPKLKSIIKDGFISCSDDTVKLPYEFLDIIKTKLRGEKFKFVNQDDLSAKWLGEHNVHLTNFREWLNQREPKYKG